MEARAQERPITTEPPAPPVTEDTTSDLGVIRLDASVLYYKEDNGRVRATEPVAAITVNRPDGQILTLRYIRDTLSGATPNGATRARFLQVFEARGGDSATGATADVAINPHALPLDPFFRDRRDAGDVGYSFLADPNLRLSVGGGYSREVDYRSTTYSAGLAWDFNQKNTTLAVAVNRELDRSIPLFGTPTPLVPIDGLTQPHGNAKKHVTSVVAGLTQVMSRTWLAQINYEAGQAFGYQTDPYRYITVVDARSGDPVQYDFEGRPLARHRQSIFVDNKIAIGATALDVSARAYADSWGIKSGTLEASWRAPVARRFYVQPSVRLYAQTKARFFRNYLVRGDPLPAYASSDARLGAFRAVTLALQAGVRLRRSDEFYVRAAWYGQMGDHHPKGGVGDQILEDQFSGVDATSLMAGYSLAYD